MSPPYCVDRELHAKVDGEAGGDAGRDNGTQLLRDDQKVLEVLKTIVCERSNAAGSWTVQNAGGEQSQLFAARRVREELPKLSPQ
eukprot:51423-Prymnesium_polylepis.1